MPPQGRKKLERIVAILLLTGTALACDLPQLPAEAPTLTPAQLIKAGHDLRAKAALLPIVEAEPSNAEAIWLLSKAYAGLNDLEKSLAHAERSVALDPENADYHIQLGVVLGRMAEKASMFKQLGLARRTRKELEAAVVLGPKNFDGLYGLMLYYFSAPSFMGGDKAKAEALADRIAAEDAAQGFLARASLAHELKDAPAELEFLLKAVQADPSNFDAHSELAQFLWNRPQPDYPILEKSACTLLELDASRPNGWRAMVELHVAFQCWTELEQVLQTSEQFNPENLSPYYAAAAAMVRRDERLPAARTYLEKYLSQPADGGEPTHAQARWQLATLFEKQQQVEDAVAQLNLAIQEDPLFEPAKKDLKRLRGK